MTDDVTLADLRWLCKMAEEITGCRRPDDAAEDLAKIERIQRGLRTLIRNKKRLQ